MTGMPVTREAAEAAAKQHIAERPDERRGLLKPEDRLTLEQCSLLLRHGGMGTHVWRVVKVYVDPSKAIYGFEQLSKSIRWGGAALYSGGQVVRIVTAPRLRSRW